MGLERDSGQENGSYCVIIGYILAFFVGNLGTYYTGIL